MVKLQVLSLPVLLRFMLQAPQASHPGLVAPFLQQVQCRLLLHEGQDKFPAILFNRLSTTEWWYDVWSDGDTIH